MLQKRIAVRTVRELIKADVMFICVNLLCDNLMWNVCVRMELC